MMFFDDNPMALPKDAIYYFNVLIISICLSIDQAALALPAGVSDIWFTDSITDPRPYAIHVYVDDGRHKILSPDEDFGIDYFPHTVLEVDPHLGISWYRMIDWETKNPWDLEPYDEDSLD